LSKTHHNATSAILALCKDAYGNALSGNEVRSMSFLACAIKTLEAQQKALASKNDSRDLMVLERTIREGMKAEDTFPPFDGSKVQASMARWASMGITAAPLDVIDPEVLKGATEAQTA